ncbi:hypothetical protein PQC65_gp203 [Aeromonas phage pAEv1810]|uniref:hypothetical protein n=1 Tax=Aeromonas phage pAEv1810 TaxID=2908744 RepID=UPI002329902C|nr:hypothetical protein PQC65_gp203 [Aeromonas phage pAEv1810]UIS25141.1 hypothetical protein pAEv1810_203 [Aeromonas phage pAEv1810]
MRIREYIILFCGSVMLFGLLPNLINKTGKEFEVTLFIFGMFALCLMLTCATYYIEWLIRKENRRELRKDRKDYNENLNLLNDFCNKD